jgi:hypothetical protein
MSHLPPNFLVAKLLQKKKRNNNFPRFFRELNMPDRVKATADEAVKMIEKIPTLARECQVSCQNDRKDSGGGEGMPGKIKCIPN